MSLLYDQQPSHIRHGVYLAFKQGLIIINQSQVKLFIIKNITFRLNLKKKIVYYKKQLKLLLTKVK